MIYWVKRKIWQIKNVIKWLPKIWNQYDFDYHYSIEVFKFQLQKQAEFLDSDKAITLCAKNRAKRIRTVIKLMDKVYNEDYALEYQSELKSMYGEDVLDFDFVPNGEFKGEKTYSMKYKYETWNNSDEVQETHDILFKMSQEKQKKAHKLLWKLIEKDIRGWWD
jgi:hypothetical protein